MYDWANSAFATTVMAGFFPLFFQKYWSMNENTVDSTSRLGFVLSMSGLIATIITLILGPATDFHGTRKRWTLVFGLFGIVATFLLGFFDAGEWQGPLLLYSIALTGFSLSCNFYDSLLPHVVSDSSRMNKISSMGYSFGYLGGGVLFLFNVIMYVKPEIFGFADGPAAVKVSFILAALWWLMFSIPFIRNVSENKSAGAEFLATREIVELFKKAWRNKRLFYFLLAFWFYIDGVYTVMSMAVDFGAGIGLGGPHLMGALLLTQFVAFPFTLLTGKLSERFAPEKILRFLIGAYIIAVICASQMTQAWEFFALAFMIGAAQGGVQSLSRSLLGNLVPAGESGRWYALMNVVGRFAAILGPFLVGLVTQLTDSHRWGIVSIAILLTLGIFLLSKSMQYRNLA